jgi:hypothetical protein
VLEITHQTFINHFNPMTLYFPWVWSLANSRSARFPPLKRGSYNSQKTSQVFSGKTKNTSIQYLKAEAGSGLTLPILKARTNSDLRWP